MKKYILLALFAVAAVSAQANCNAPDTTIATGINESAAASLKVYPNPATDILHVSAPAALAGAAYNIFDALGNAVISGHLPAEPFTINTADLPHGVYMLIINRNATQVFVIR